MNKALLHKEINSFDRINELYPKSIALPNTALGLRCPEV